MFFVHVPPPEGLVQIQMPLQKPLQLTIKSSPVMI